MLRLSYHYQSHHQGTAPWLMTRGSDHASHLRRSCIAWLPSGGQRHELCISQSHSPRTQSDRYACEPFQSLAAQLVECCVAAEAIPAVVFTIYQCHCEPAKIAIDDTTERFLVCAICNTTSSLLLWISSSRFLSNASVLGGSTDLIFYVLNPMNYLVHHTGVGAVRRSFLDQSCPSSPPCMLLRRR